MGKAAIAFALITLTSMPVLAQGRAVPRDSRAQGIPPGQLPPAGECRVWYDGVPPGRQPRATSCRDAERIASRNRNARVIYGARRGDDGRWGRPSPRDRVYQSPAFRNGYDDGYREGGEDARDNDRYDPLRHGRYRSADRGYDDDYGSREQYGNIYRDGFRAGYEDGYRDWISSRPPRR